jgi:preprotein translocase subunit SecG
MSEQHSRALSQSKSGPGSLLRRHWWVLTLIMLFVLIGIIYLLSHLSAADSEMYPTTMLSRNLSIFRLC